MKSVVAREHDRALSNGSVAPGTVRQHESHANPEARAVQGRMPPNPLWVITIAMGVFFAVVGALVAVG